MLVIFLILFTKVFADSDENKYVDLLPDNEKRQFIENVAKKIIKQVETEANPGTHAVSGEQPDEQLKKQNDYVKKLLKEEVEISLRSRSEKTGDSSSGEKDFGVEPLEGNPDSMLRMGNDKIALKNPNDYIKIEIVTDEVPIIKRSIQNDKSNESKESDVSSSYSSENVESQNAVESVTDRSTSVEVASKINPQPAVTPSIPTRTFTVSTNEETVTPDTNETAILISTESPTSKQTIIDSDSIEFKTENTGGVKPIPASITEEKSKEFDYESKNIANNKTSDNKIKQIVSKLERDFSETDDEAVKVKGLGTSLRKLNDDDGSEENITDIDPTTAKNNEAQSESNSNENSNVSNSDEGELTTLTYPKFSTVANSEKTEDIVTETTITTENEEKLESTTENITTQDITTEIPTTLEDFTETSTSITIVPTTEDVKINYTVYDTTTQEITDLPISTDGTVDKRNASNPTSESTLTSTMIDDGTTESLNDTVSSISITSTTKTTTAETITENSASIVTDSETPSTTTTEKVTEYTPTTTEKMKIIVEYFTSAPRLDKELPDSEIKPKEAPKKHKAIIHKYFKPKAGPKSINNKKKSVNNNGHPTFIELEKVYYNDNYKVASGKGYHVYEIPADKSPFVQEEVFTEQPYYVPVYDYSPKYAYINPHNRFRPNPGDTVITNSEKVGVFTIGDDENDDTHLRPFNDLEQTQNINMAFSNTFDVKRKKFGSKQKEPHSLHKQPQQNVAEKKRVSAKVDPADYLDSDYYFGIRKHFGKRRSNTKYNDQFPNSDEDNHPTHSIQESKLKDHVRAVRNILIHQKFFGVLDRGRERERSELRERYKSTLKKSKLMKENILRQNHEQDLITEDENKKEAIITVGNENVNEASKHFQKVGYLKNAHSTKELYVMDDFFKHNVAKYIKERDARNEGNAIPDVTPATPHPTVMTELPEPARSDFEKEETRPNSAIIQAFADHHENEDNKIEPENLVSNTNNDTKILKDEGEIRVNEVINENEALKDTATNSSTQNVTTTIKPDFNTSNVNNPKKEPNVNFRANRRNDGVEISVYLDVLKDMIITDNKALQQYDWLGTAVDVQASLQKLFQLNDLVVNNENIHPSDMEIIKYVVFLHKLGSEIIEANNFGTQLRKKLALPRNKKKKLKPRFLKEKGLLNRVWLYLRRELPEVDEHGALNNLNKFLMDIEDSLYELHDAIKNIAKVTKYKNQHWYKNLKELYLNTDEKHVLEVLLHLAVTRLFDLIEESAKTGLEDDYLQYMKRKKKEAKKTLEEMIFVINIVNEINKNLE